MFYSGYGFGIYSREIFLLSDGSGFGNNVIILKIIFKIRKRHSSFIKFQVQAGYYVDYNEIKFAKFGWPAETNLLKFTL